MAQLRETLKTQDSLDTFDRVVFESIVEKIIVGGYDAEGNPAPYKLTFVLKGNRDITADYNLEKYRAKQKEIKNGRVS